MNARLTLIQGALLLLAGLAPAQADLLADIRKNKQVKVGIAVGVPRFSYLDTQQQLQGSDVETARLLAQDLGVGLQVVPVSNAERVSMLEARKVDMVISSLSITPERERLINFSIPYARLYTIVAARPEISIRSYADLAKRPIGVTLQTSNASLIAQFAPQAIVSGFANDAELISASVKGKTEIISTQHAVLDEINRQAGQQLFEEKFVQKEFDLAIGLPKQEKPLRDWVNDWLARHLRAGTLNQIYRKHHQRDLPPELRPAPISRQG